MLGGTIALGACASTRTQEAPGEYTDDAVITAKVKAELVENKQVSAANINVETFRGVVQLSGFADNQAEINAAVAEAKAVKGVKSVKNDIRVKTAP
ncbi:MAG: BON domain-containing protein [Gammaproteobacteria bacterium]